MEMERVKQLQDQFKASDKLEKNVKTLTEKQNLVSLTFAVNGDQLVGFGNAQAIVYLCVCPISETKLPDRLETSGQKYIGFGFFQGWKALLTVDG